MVMKKLGKQLQLLSVASLMTFNHYYKNQQRHLQVSLCYSCSYTLFANFKMKLASYIIMFPYTTNKNELTWSMKTLGC